MSQRLTLDGVKKSFGATAALRGVSLGVGEGEVHALIGVVIAMSGNLPPRNY